MKEQSRKTGGGKVIVTQSSKAAAAAATADSTQKIERKAEPAITSSSKSIDTPDKKKLVVSGTPEKAVLKSSTPLSSETKLHKDTEMKKEVAPVTTTKNPFAKVGAVAEQPTKSANVFGAFAETQKKKK